MWSVVACYGDEAEREQILEYVGALAMRKNGRWSLRSAPAGRSFMRG